MSNFNTDTTTESDIYLDQLQKVAAVLLSKFNEIQELFLVLVDFHFEFNKPVAKFCSETLSIN